MDKDLSEKPVTNNTLSGAASSLTRELISTAPPAKLTDNIDNAGDSSLLPKSSSSNIPDGDEETPPPEPPRPLSPRQQAELTLKEAFPGIDHAVIKAVLTASGGKIEPAFNALLSMSDPDAKEEPSPAPLPPRPVRSPHVRATNTSTPLNQLEADALYARQLAEHYQGTIPYQPNVPRKAAKTDTVPLGRRQGPGLRPNELQEDDHSFLDDDLPVIKENIRRTFLETQSKVNKWVSDFKKRIDGEEPAEASNDGARYDPKGYSRRLSQQSYGVRRSGDRDRYDADPQVLGDDFAALELRDDEPPPPRRTTRPLANPDLFKPTSAPLGSGARRVSFQAGPPTEIGPSPPSQPERKPSPADKLSKWEPLSAIDPGPAPDSDPFSLGDSDDERETKPKVAGHDHPDHVQKAASDATTAEIGKPKAESDIPTKPGF